MVPLRIVYNSRHWRKFRSLYVFLTFIITAVLFYLSQREGYETLNNPLKKAIIYELLPYLKEHKTSLIPVEIFKGKIRQNSDVVIGVHTMKSDKESKVIQTLNNLTIHLSEEECCNTLIIVFIAETEYHYVTSLSKKILELFNTHVQSGLIQILAPSPYYYPNWNDIGIGLTGPISAKRAELVKQNLDIIHIIACAQSRGSYFLLLEDSAIISREYMKEIKIFTAAATVSNPNWVILEIIQFGRTRKVIKISHLKKFVIYIQLFVEDMPLDKLIEGYLIALCGNDFVSNKCLKTKKEIYTKYNSSHFYVAGSNSFLDKVQNKKIYRLKQTSGYGELQQQQQQQMYINKYLNQSLSNIDNMKYC